MYYYKYKASLRSRDGLISAQVTRRGLNVVMNAEINPSRRTQRYRTHFLVGISIWNGKIKNNPDSVALEHI